MSCNSIAWEDMAQAFFYVQQNDLCGCAVIKAWQWPQLCP